MKETCLFGPDSLGNFATSEVDYEFAETCPRLTCTCSSHDNYTEVARERLATAARVYAVEIGAEFKHNIDPSLIINGDEQRRPTSTEDTSIFNPQGSPEEIAAAEAAAEEAAIIAA